MNSNKNYFELIDSYLNGQMSGQEVADFESQLQKDPLLESEFQLQKDIVESIRQYRKTELKAALDAVEVGVTGGGFTGLKIAASILIASLLGTGIYFYAQEDNTSNTIAKQEIIDNTPEVAETADENLEEIQPITENNTEELSDDLMVDEESVTETVADQPVQMAITSENTTEATIEEKPVQPNINLPEVVEDFKSAEEGSIAENIDVPENNLDKVTETVIPKTQVMEMKKGKYAFHYQFYNNKLYLYGEFENTYEILELNTPSGISIYMFYKDNFYELMQNQEKITPLKAIADDSLLQDLKIIRKK